MKSSASEQGLIKLNKNSGTKLQLASVAYEVLGSVGVRKCVL